jgi:predicted nucleic acid-binding protein
MPALIFDNTVLSNFASAGKLEMLARLYAKGTYTTVEVLEELKRGLERGYTFLAAAVEAVEGGKAWLKILEVESAEETRLRLELDEFLHPGESSCLVFAVSRGMILATDDLAARRRASRRGVHLTGTVGILVEMVRSDLLKLEEANGILSTMIGARYLAPCERLDDLL